MCGICGFLGAGSADDLGRMMSRLVHRGPDGFGYWSSTTPPVQLGSRRLSIVDLQGGHQPMATADGELVIVFNGEIYNHVDLRKELQQLGHQFRTDHSDTEVILLGYREWGPKLLHRLNGMWAFALYDASRKVLFCSRDRFGEKPFYYATVGGTFVFGSEITSVVEHPGIQKNVSRRSLQKYFAYGYIPSPLSIYERVFKLPAGHSLYVDAVSGASRIEKYWDFLLEPLDSIPSHAEEEWGQELRELLDRAVHRRLQADVPVGIFLSGGVDSSAVAAFATRHIGAETLKTFSIGFAEKSFDETEFGRLVSAKFKTKHEIETLSLDRALGLVDACLCRLDEPLGDSSLLPTYLLSGLTRKEVKVALGGDGGDELFAGYDPFLALKYAQLYQKILPRPVHTGIKALFGRMPVSQAHLALDFKIKRALRGLDYGPLYWLPVWMAPLDLNSIGELFGERVDINELYSEAIEQWEACPQTDLTAKTLQFYTKLYLQDDILVKTDRASMMHSLELRSPFLDVELVNFVRRIPSNYKFRDGTTKYIFKKALKDILPDNILRRKKKGFGPPIGAWFKSGALQVDDVQFPGLNGNLIKKKIVAHRSGKSDERNFLWCFYVLKKWAKANESIAA
jgi:asparagine synthase (glutamine-hydrolysing)